MTTLEEDVLSIHIAHVMLEEGVRNTLVRDILRYRLSLRRSDTIEDNTHKFTNKHSDKLFKLMHKWHYNATNVQKADKALLELESYVDTMLFEGELTYGD